MLGVFALVLNLASIVGQRVATSRHQSFEELASEVEVAFAAGDMSRSCALGLGVVAGVGDLTSASGSLCSGELSTTFGGELSTIEFRPIFGELRQDGSDI
jgi:hypothetical protein